MGAFPNWYLGLTELYLRNPQADAYLMCQDDVYFAKDLRAYLEASLWPDTQVGVVSLYCPSHEHREVSFGFHKINPGWRAYGALAYIFSNPGLREFLSDEIVLNHRHHGPTEGLRNIDSVVGAWCERMPRPYYVHIPSLVQHMGETSTIREAAILGARRQAIVFDPDTIRKNMSNHINLTLT